MGLTDSIKGAFLRSLLTHLTDGDHGSTYIGTIAALALGANLEWSKILHGFADQESAIECGKLAGLFVLWTWAYYTGKKKISPTPSK